MNFGFAKILSILICLVVCQAWLPEEASARPVKKTVSLKKGKQKTVAAKKGQKTAQAGQKAKKKAQADPEKSLWLKRAGESSVLKGKASWYGRDFHNKKTASGVRYDMHTFTAAHRTLPMGTVVKVTDQINGRSVMVCVNDRGPFVKGRIIDLSYAAAKKLDLSDRGVSSVALEVVSDAKGRPLSPGQAYFVKYVTENGKTSLGPFRAFADATAMQQALTQAHPEVEVVLETIDEGK